MAMSGRKISESLFKEIHDQLSSYNAGLQGNIPMDDKAIPDMSALQSIYDNFASTRW
jgi:hypothetical protein